MSYLDFGLVDARLDGESKRRLDEAVRDDGILDEQQLIEGSRRTRARRARPRKNGGGS